MGKFVVLITLILWWIFWSGWGIGELEGFFARFPFGIPLVYSSGAFLLFFLVNILLFTDKKKNSKEAVVLKQLSNLVVRNGKHFCFWKDIWYGAEPLSETFHNIYNGCYKRCLS